MVDHWVYCSAAQRAAAMAGWTVDRKVAESAWTTAVSTELKKAAH